VRVGVCQGEVACRGLGTMGSWEEVVGEKYDGDGEEAGETGTDGRVVEDMVVEYKVWDVRGG